MSLGAVIGGGLLLILTTFAGVMLGELAGDIEHFFGGLAVVGVLAAVLIGYSGAFVPGASTLPAWSFPGVVVYCLRDTGIRPSHRIFYGAATAGAIFLGLIFLAMWS